MLYSQGAWACLFPHGVLEERGETPHHEPVAISVELGEHIAHNNEELHQVEQGHHPVEGFKVHHTFLWFVEVGWPVGNRILPLSTGVRLNTLRIVTIGARRCSVY